jgi:ribosomal protein S18 acetylase RimI-like enzyme
MLAMGIQKVTLHVFGDNTVARSLYRKLGFVETNVVMAKSLG